MQSLLLLLTFMHFGASAASRYYSESDFADATDIRLEVSACQLHLCGQTGCVSLAIRGAHLVTTVLLKYALIC